MRHRNLVLFARRPHLGAGKRRLARLIGGLAALRFETAQLRANLRRLRKPVWTCWLALARRPGQSSFQSPGWRLCDQGHGNLGRRMSRVIGRLPTGPVVLVGNDIPMLRAGHIAAAFQALGRADLVFGPAEDGGYWLIGLAPRVRRKNLFHQVRWSGPHALEDTLANAAGLCVAKLEQLWDVDDEDGWRRFRASASDAPAAGG